MWTLLGAHSAENNDTERGGGKIKVRMNGRDCCCGQKRKMRREDGGKISSVRGMTAFVFTPLGMSVDARCVAYSSLQ